MPENSSNIVELRLYKKRHSGKGRAIFELDEIAVLDELMKEHDIIVERLQDDEF